MTKLTIRFEEQCVAHSTHPDMSNGRMQMCLRGHFQHDHIARFFRLAETFARIQTGVAYLS